MSAVEEISPVDFIYDELKPIPVHYGYAGVILSALFFQVVCHFVGKLGKPKSVKDSDEWKWRNLLVSWIHAVIIGVWDLSCFFLYPELMTDLIAFHNMYIYFMVTFSTGYFVYDFIDLFVSGQAIKMWELIPHHISVAGTFFFNVVQSRCLAFNVIALLAEVNSIFLHARKLLQLAGVPYHRLIYRVNSAMNLFTFVSCRFLGLAWIVYGMFMWHFRVSFIYLVILSATMFILWVTNAILFWRLLSSDLLRDRLRKRRPSGGLSNGHSTNGYHSLSKSVHNGVSANGNGGKHAELCCERCVSSSEVKE